MYKLCIKYMEVFSSFWCYKSELVCTDEWSTNATLTLCWSLFSIRQASCHSVLSAFFCFQKIMCNSKHVCTHSFVKSLLTHRFLHTVFVSIDQLLVFLRQEILLRLSVLFPLQPSLLERAQKGQGDFRHSVDRHCVRLQSANMNTFVKSWSF